MTGRVEERHDRILRLVRERGTMRVIELAEELGTSQETMRRDLVALADVGRLRRIHGKVAWPTAALSARDARLARHEAAGDQPVIGMIVPASGYVDHDVIRGARAAAAKAGARLLVGVTDNSPAQDEVQLRAMAKAGADGLLLTPTWGNGGPSPQELARLADLEVPAVILERQIPPGTPAAWLDRVSSDHANGAARAVRHLAGLGHRRVALLARRTHSEPQIRVGYRAAVDALGLPRDEVDQPGTTTPDDITTDITTDVISDITSDMIGGRTGGRTGEAVAFEDRLDLLVAMAHQGEVRAALVHTDNDAVNLLYRLIAEGVRVPEDFALISYGNDLLPVTDVPLTAVAPAKHALGEAALTLLLRRLADPMAERQHVAFVPQLIVRGSCGAETDAGKTEAGKTEAGKTEGRKADQPQVPRPRR